ncbi:MAG TPA: hypothetical protein VJU84_09425 [Pyrinomonadaceae bacterium]|nr:hypothetical protein [Pyrinomonadaceae bacterium]
MKSRALVPLLIVACGLFAVVKTTGQDEPAKVDKTEWEYLVVATPSNVNFTATGNQRMRKEPGPFGREAFVLEQHLDKLGANGWELVSVAGTPADPHYYFKRRK